MGIASRSSWPPVHALSGQAFRSPPNAFGGQALLETVLFVPVFVALFTALAWFWRIESAAAALSSAAEYGTTLIVHANLGREQVSSEIVRVLTGGACARLDRSKLKVEVKIGRVVPPPYFGPEFSSVKISYVFALPQWLGSSVTVRGVSHVLNDSFTTVFGAPDNLNHS